LAVLGFVATFVVTIIPAIATGVADFVKDGDYIHISAELLNPRYAGYSTSYTFGNLNNKYGKDNKYKRLMLHASKLIIKIPDSKNLIFESNISKDFHSLISK